MLNRCGENDGACPACPVAGSHCLWIRHWDHVGEVTLPGWRYKDEERNGKDEERINDLFKTMIGE